jgi:hypothetical protein
VDLDRPKPGFTPEKVFSGVAEKLDAFFLSTVKPNKLILLMHERAFRLYGASNPRKYLSMFQSFLDLLKSKGIGTDIISNY